MMNTNIVISLDERREKKDGSYPLVMRLGHNKRTTAIPLDVSLQKIDWDNDVYYGDVDHPVPGQIDHWVS